MQSHLNSVCQGSARRTLWVEAYTALLRRSSGQYQCPHGVSIISDMSSSSRHTAHCLRRCLLSSSSLRRRSSSAAISACLAAMACSLSLRSCSKAFRLCSASAASLARRSANFSSYALWYASDSALVTFSHSSFVCWKSSRLVAS